MANTQTPEKVKNWNGTVHYAAADGTPACGPISTHNGWLSPSVATVTCERCISRFGADAAGQTDPEIVNEHAARRTAERAVRRAARA